MIFCIICVGIILTFLIILSLYSYTTDDGFGAGLICGASIIIFLIVEVLIICDKAGVLNKRSTPKAIDVYRGKTELEVTSVNGVPIDTVVVWKEIDLKNQ